MNLADLCLFVRIIDAHCHGTYTDAYSGEMAASRRLVNAGLIESIPHVLKNHPPYSFRPTPRGINIARSTLVDALESAP